MRRFLFPIILLALVAALFVGCDTRDPKVISYDIVSLEVNPGTIYVDADQAAEDIEGTTTGDAEVTATVQDGDGNPVSDVEVKFQTTLGAITGSVMTDASGQATAYITYTGTKGGGTVTAKAGKNTAHETFTIAEDPYYRIISMTATKDTIYADNGITTSEISVLVKDSDNYFVTGESVRFRTSLGRLISAATTDTTGVAKTIFYDDGEAGEALIEATIGTATANKTVVVATNPSYEIPVVSTNQSSYVVDSVINVIVYFTNSNNEDVADGTPVRITTTQGEFIDDSDEGGSLSSTFETTTMNGRVEVSLNVGTSTKSTTVVKAEIAGNIGQKELTLLPANPYAITLESDLAQITSNSEETTEIRAFLFDIYGNSIPNKSVNFETTLGRIDPPMASTQVNDDIDGDGIEDIYAASTFSAGLDAGAAEITAKFTGILGGQDQNTEVGEITATHSVQILSEGVSYIRFVNQSDVVINPIGTGGNESYQAVVELYDLGGNIVTANKQVSFTLLSAPAGTNINNQAYNVGDVVTVTSTNGMAAVAINSGTDSGPIQLKSFLQENDAISATKSNVIVASGSPAFVDLAIDGNNSGEEFNAGVWKVEISALVTDSYGNPVQDGTVVSFSIPEEQPDDIDTDNIGIYHNAFVGNENADGDSLPGRAFSWITYPGTMSNKVVTFKVTVASGNILIEDTFDCILPFHNVSLIGHIEPGHLKWLTNGYDTRYCLLFVKAIDGMESPIDDLKLRFNSTRGFTLAEHTNDGTPDINGNPQPDGNIYTEITGAYHTITTPNGYDQNEPAGPSLITYNGQAAPGESYKLWAFAKDECTPPPQPGVPGVTDVAINVEVIDSQVAPLTLPITIYRWQ